ncbi:putative HTH-type transcriptional regulator [Phycisphaerae bacterium]|jgi:Rrf2 family protein|nr:putative HTH-type transcriptional regulator [Phycisphaerae bacterium]
MLSQASGYAASALGFVACSDSKSVLVKDIAEATAIPAPYLAKIVQVLSKRGIVRTQRGIGGGVTLARAPEDITLHDICVALDDPAVLNRCMLGTAICSDDRACPCHSFWKANRGEFQDFLRKTTVADMAEFEKRAKETGKNRTLWPAAQVAS